MPMDSQILSSALLLVLQPQAILGMSQNKGETGLGWGRTSGDLHHQILSLTLGSKSDMGLLDFPLRFSRRRLENPH